ncbi:MAG TPA: glycosyltransferase family 39 protein [Planctomycetaceae bacterium]
MTAGPIEPPDRRPIPRHSWLILAAVAAAFLIVRLPVMYRQPGGQDEDLFAVPGWTVLQEGIPRIPYAPSRNPDGVLYKADVALFTLPPAYFYWQAPFFAVFGPSYGTARLASAAAGLVAIWLVYWLARQFYQDERAALWAAGLYSLSRVLFFPCLTARPDMLCGAIGLGAVACAWRWHRSRRLQEIAAVGALLGVGMLTHPFALVFSIQVGLWVFFGSRGWMNRVRNSGVLVGTALAVFALWLPLILNYPEIFRSQFFNNVLGRAGPGLIRRLVFPWDALPHQASLLLEHAGVWQVVLMGLGLVIATAHDLRSSVRRTQSGPLAATVLAWSSIYLLIACQGTHVTKGYWCYPGAFLFICVGRSVALFTDRLRVAVPYPRLAAWGGALFLVAVMLPGAGLRTWAAHLRHWSDPVYDARRFVRLVLRDLPPDTRHLVDPAYVFDVYLAGRPTMLATIDEFYFGAIGMPYDYLIASRYDLERDVPDAVDGRFVRAYGDPADPFACYAEVYESARRSDEK